MFKACFPSRSGCTLVSIRVRLLLLVLGAVLLPAILVGWRYYQDRGKDIEVAISG